MLLCRTTGEVQDRLTIKLPMIAALCPYTAADAPGTRDTRTPDGAEGKPCTLVHTWYSEVWYSQKKVCLTACKYGVVV